MMVEYYGQSFSFHEASLINNLHLFKTIFNDFLSEYNFKTCRSGGEITDKLEILLTTLLNQKPINEALIFLILQNHLSIQISSFVHRIVVK